MAPLLVSTEVMASIRWGALDSEYSTNTSRSFMAVFTTSRNWATADDEFKTPHKVRKSKTKSVNKMCKPTKIYLMFICDIDLSSLHAMHLKGINEDRDYNLQCTFWCFCLIVFALCFPVWHHVHLLYALWWIQSPLHACCVSATLKKKKEKKKLPQRH